MGKLLKPLIIVQLLFSIAALVLGIMLFQQREMLKGRTQKLEQAAASFAQKIRHTDFRVERIQSYETMDGPLNRLAVAGENLYEELQVTKQDLENTRQDLAQTKVELSSTKAELADARDQIAQLNDALDQRDAELARANSRVENLEQQTADLQGELDGLQDDFAKLEEDLSDCEASYDSLKVDFEKLVGETTGGPTARGLTGRVLLVNPDWNFVVLDIGSEGGLNPAAEMLVHRDDTLVGRVRVSSVEENLAVAEILRDWSLQTIRKGDYVVSPES